MSSHVPPNTSSFTNGLKSELKGPSMDEIKHLPCTISNIIKVLKMFTNVGQVNYINSADLCIAAGNTGCGKSTMLLSLCYGVNSLQE